MTRQERNTEMNQLEGVSRELVANKKVIEAMAVLENGIPSLRVLTLQGDWRVIDELTARGL